jgi:tRNA A-37 threonylcarbamoyl transferase component Bud32
MPERGDKAMTVPTPELQEAELEHEPESGELFAHRYRLGPLLGRGGTALVHRAVDVRLRRPVALKVFRLDADAELVGRFIVEARLLARLHHPGLVEIFDFGHVPQGPYLALELISGPTLRRLLAVGPLPFAETMRVGQVMAGILAYIHAAGVVHRDVNPANILLDEHGHLRLTDFGVSLAVDAAETMTAGMVVGTAAYLAPEQVLGDRADPAADIFALGLVLIECLTGRREYPGPPAESAVARLQRLPSVPQGLPRGVSQILERMTAWDPAERPDAEQCAAVFGTPGKVYPTPTPPERAVPPFDADDETTHRQGPGHPVPGLRRGMSVTRERELLATLVEVADTLVADFDIIDFLHTLSARCVELLDVDAACLILIDDGGRLHSAAASTENARALEVFELQTDAGPCVDCCRTGEPVVNADLRANAERWPRFAEAAQASGFVAVHALPLRLRQTAIGALNLFAADSRVLSEDDARAGQALADVATIGILCQRGVHQADLLATQLQAALTSRIAIEHAKGVLAERRRVTVDEALALLRDHARSHHLRLSDLARDIAEGSTAVSGPRQTLNPSGRPPDDLAKAVTPRAQQR